MPLTAKGAEILRSMEKTYPSEKKAEQVLYASKNAGKITGIDESGEVAHLDMAKLDAACAKMDAIAGIKRLDEVMIDAACAALDQRH